MEYLKLCELYEKIVGTSKHIYKTYYISEFLKKCSDQELSMAVLLLQGRVFPEWDSRKIGVASQTVIKALSMLTKLNTKEINRLWKEKGDLGNVVEIISKKKSQQSLFQRKLTIKDVHSNLTRIATYSGTGAIDFKIKTIVNLLLSASAIESKYIIRTILEEMRVGVGNGIMKDAIAWAFLPKAVSDKIEVSCFGICPHCKKIVPTQKVCLNCNEINENYIIPKETINLNDINDFWDYLNKTKKIFFYFKSPNAKQIVDEGINKIIERAHNLSNDFSEVALISKTKGVLGLKKVNLKPLIPVNLMLYIKAPSLKDALNSFKKPVAIEYKYDGFRLQIHKLDETIKLFTRRLEDVTKQFPDVVETIKTHVNGNSFILDSEVVGRDPKTKKYLAFQKISQRIKRKFKISDAIKLTPVEVNSFDLLYYDGKNMMDLPFIERRKLLSKIVKEEPFKIVLAKQIITSDLKEAESFYKESLNVGNEGVMIKSLNAKYEAGRKVGHGLKVKPIMETLDLVITAAEWGEGKRKGWLTTYELACLDDDNNYVTIGKVGTGFKELETSGLTFKKMSEMLKPLIIKTSGKRVQVKPEIVIEVAYEEIQKSQSYSSGYALRFPRVIRLRDDLNPDEISNLKLVNYLYLTQRGRNKVQNKELNNKNINN